MIVRAHKISFSPDRTPMPKVVKIGFEGDNMVERLMFKLPDIAAAQTAQLMLGGRYANMVTLIEGDEDGRYYVDLTAELIGESGRTESYVVIDGENGEVWQSGVLYLSVGDVPDVETEIEQRFPTAVEQMRQEMAAHDAAMDEAAENVLALAQSAQTAAENAAASMNNAQTAAENAAESAASAREASVQADTAAEIATIAAAQADTAADRADDAVHRMPVIGENGNWQLWDAAKGEYVDSGVSASGGSGEGAPGGYYMPSVSAAGVLTWTPSREDMPGVSSANVKGPQGETGAQGPQGEKGDTGAQGPQGEKGDKGEQGPKGDTGAAGADGKDGTSVTVKSVSESSADGGSNTVTFSDGKTLTVKNGSKGDTGAQGPQGEKGDTGAAGKDGTSITHSWSGTTLTVTSASGTSSANLKGDIGAQGPKGDTGAQGEKGDTGAAGKDGANGKDGSDGVGIKSVVQTTTSSADGGSNVITVTKTDNTTSTFTVKNGSKGSTGAAGADGKTPVKGTDYFTAADIAEMTAAVKAALTSETWTFTLSDGSTVTKKVYAE